MQYKVLTLNQIAQVGLKNLVKDKYQLVTDWKDNPDAVIVRSAVLHDVPLPDSVKAVVRAGAGVNNIPIKECTQKGIAVFNTPGANANAVKELVLAGMLLSTRGISEGIAFSKGLAQHTGSHDEIAKLIEKEKKLFVGTEIYGKTLGVVGLGAIGARVCDMATSLGLTVFGYDPMLSVDAAIRLSPKVQRLDDLKKLLARCDYVSLHLPVLAETKRMMNVELISTMKQGAVLLNFARGEIVDSKAVLAALDSGKLGRYVCDFPDVEMAKHAKVLATPHLGASTQEAEDNCAVMGIDQLIDFLENGNVRNSVNLPCVTLERAGRGRVTVMTRGSTQHTSQIVAALEQQQVKIVEMVSKCNSELSYTIIDVEAALPTNFGDAIKKIDDVVAVRVF